MTLSIAQFQSRQALLRRGIRPLIAQGASLETLLTRLIENIEGQSHSMLAAVFLYDRGRNGLTIASAPNLRPASKKAVNGFECGPQQPACGSAVFHRQVVIAHDVKSDPLWKDLKDFAETSGFRAVWSQPIFSADKIVLGTIAFYSPEPRTPDQIDFMVLQGAADIALEIIQSRTDEARVLIEAGAEAESRHQCVIYEGAPSLQLPRFAALIQRKLTEGYRCLYLNNPAMVAGLRSSLAARGIEVGKEIAAGRLILSSESNLADDGSFDVTKMLLLLEDAVEQAVKDGFKGLWATGDMTWEFGSEKNLSKLLEYEFRLEKIFRRTDKLDGICQYHKDSLPSQALRDGILSHQHIFTNETISRLNPHFLESGCLEDRKTTDMELDRAIEFYSIAH